MEFYKKIPFNTVGIYKITSPSNRVYIGQSKCIRRRFRMYNNLACEKQIKLYNSLSFHGVNNHTFEVIQECEIDELNKLERYYQELYNSVEKGLNCVYVDEKNGSYLRTKKIREENSKRRKGVYRVFVSVYDKITKSKFIGDKISVSEKFDINLRTLEYRLKYDYEKEPNEKYKNLVFNFEPPRKKIFKPYGKKSKELNHHNGRVIRAVNKITKEEYVNNIHHVALRFKTTRKYIEKKIKYHIIKTDKKEVLDEWDFYDDNLDIKNKLYNFDAQQMYLDLETGIYYYSMKDLSKCINKTIGEVKAEKSRKKQTILFDRYKVIIMKNEY